MKFLMLASSVLVASLSLTSCVSEKSDKYYDLGFKIGSSAGFINAWEKGVTPFTFNELCEDFFDDYKQETGDTSFILPSREDFALLLKGCSDGYRDTSKP